MTVCSYYSFPVTWENLSNTNCHKRMLRCYSQQTAKVKRFSFSCLYHVRAKGYSEEILPSLCDRARRSVVGHLPSLLLGVYTSSLSFPYFVHLEELSMGCFSLPAYVFYFTYLLFVCVLYVFDLVFGSSIQLSNSKGAAENGKQGFEPP